MRCPQPPRGARLTAAALLSFALPVPGQGASPLDPQVGKVLFAQLCATCHGTEGKGDGPDKVEPRPRDLTSGKFSFGNTEAAVFHTISRGIPPTMPAFDASLSEEHRRAVTAFVLSLMPARRASTPTERRMQVGDAAVVARAYLPPRQNGAEPLAHGLAIGLPGGLNAIFRTDDVRLLEVRRGELLERTDWRGRGGTAVKLLGDRFFALRGGDPAPCFTGGDRQPLRARFAGTVVRGARAALRYQLDNDRHLVAGEVTEQVEFLPVQGGLGLLRTLGFARGGVDGTVHFAVGHLPDGTSLLHRDVVEQGGGQMARLVGKADGDELAHAWLLVRSDGGVSLQAGDDGVVARVDGDALLRIGYLRTRTFDDMALQAITAEVLR